MIIATATIGLIFLYLTIATFSMLNKARMYPPKKNVKATHKRVWKSCYFFLSL
ncbi:hypothetical protein [Anoxybacillus sp. KU2-6(11)]|uniref:hypothetical protein n=1 Tax=Anoxybacillus sp. KU2-6(11) TaxID=1535751 RepID=UPI000AF80DDC|nr:hypothetical protein [Anoxybacillus sp. KU2-6(11)]